MSELKVRASSWGELFDCAHRWEGKQMLGMRLPSSPRSHLGHAIHAGTAAFDQARIDCLNITPDDAAGVLVDALRDPTKEVAWSRDDLTLREAEHTGIALLARYCTEISPAYNFVAVEMETKPLSIDCGNGVTVILTGTLDRSRIKLGSYGKGISDLKSGGAAVQNGVAKTKGHKPQLGAYELLFEHSTGEVITEPADIIGLKTKGKPEVATAEVEGAKALMVGTEERPGLIQYAAEMFRAGLFPPNPQSQLCSPKYCPRWTTCAYHD